MAFAVALEKTAIVCVSLASPAMPVTYVSGEQ